MPSSAVAQIVDTPLPRSFLKASQQESHDMASEGVKDMQVEAPTITFLELPEEIQAGICGHCSQNDLICLSLVCHRLRDLAAAQLYRTFNIVFPDEDAPYYDAPIDGLAGGLDTFATSDYNYASHLREFSLDTLSGGSQGETAYKPYLTSTSCGKFMNTLLLLTLRKARSLDRFKWNVRVELSRQVYKALHDIQSLRYFHVRLQQGSSLYSTPPPLPLPSGNLQSSGSSPSSMAIPNHGMDFLVPHGLFGLTAGPSSSTKTPWKNRPQKTKLAGKEPRTISGFKNLQSLSVLDIDNYDVVEEIAACVRNSSPSLRKLKLSFSFDLATKARRPQIEMTDGEESDEDEFGPIITAPQVDHEANGPAKVLKAQEEKILQDAVLGRILGTEPLLKGEGVEALLRRTEDTTKVVPEEWKSSGPHFPETAELRKLQFHSEFERMCKKFVAFKCGTDDMRRVDASEQMGILLKAAKKYADLDSLTEDKENGVPVLSVTAKLPDAKTPETSADSPEVVGDLATAPPPVEPASDSNVAKSTVPVTEGESTDDRLQSKFTFKSTTKSDDPNPDDIDITVPEEEDFDRAQDAVLQEEEVEAQGGDISTADTVSWKEPDEDTTLVPTSTVSNPPVIMSGPSSGGEPTDGEAAASYYERRLCTALSHLKDEADALLKKITSVPTNDTGNSGADTEGHHQDARVRLEAIRQDVSLVTHELNILEAAKNDEDIAENGQAFGDRGENDLGSRISKYTRGTRGLGLASLSLHLIPIRASVLGRAIDLHSLKSITLLNVGSQSTFWNLMTKEGRLKPLQVRNIMTDHVSALFLKCVSELERVDELLLLERASKYKPSSFAPGVDTRITQIRKLVLKKHMHTLKRLVVKNEASLAWDMDPKTILLLCKRGKALEELAVIINMPCIHHLMRNLTALANLRALQFIHFRHDDTCVSVLKETKRFIVDVISHHPEMKLEWLSMGGGTEEQPSAAHIVRVPKTTKKVTEKPKAIPPIASPFSTAGEAVTMADGTESSSDSGEEEEEECQSDAFVRPKLELVERIAFCDVFGVKIFHKEIVHGRL